MTDQRGAKECESSSVRQQVFFDVDDNGKANGKSRQRVNRDEGLESPRLLQLQERLGSVEEKVTEVATIVQRLYDLLESKQLAKEFYTTIEVATILGRRPYTVREWCRLQRVNAEKSMSGRGVDEEWRISADEIRRIQNEGLLPIPAKY